MEKKVLSLRIIMDDEFEEKFNKIKSELGLNSNAEVVRFLVNRFYKELMKKGILISFAFKLLNFGDALYDLSTFARLIELCAAV